MPKIYYMSDLRNCNEVLKLPRFETKCSTDKKWRKQICNYEYEDIWA